MPRPELAPLAEATFAYIDELSQLSAEGYSAERAESVSERHANAGLVHMLIEASLARSPSRLRGEVGRLLPASAAALVLREPPRRPGHTLGHGVIAVGLERRVGVRDRAGPRRRAGARSLAAAIGEGQGSDRSRGPDR